MAAMRLYRDGDILERRETLEDAGDLERPRETEMRAIGRGTMGDVVSVENNFSRIGLEHSGQLGDERGLASAIGSDDRVDLAGQNVEIEVLGGRYAAEMLVQSFDLQDRLSHPPASLRE